MTRIVVAGAGGYVGGRLVELLADVGHEVVALGTRPRPWLDRPGVEQVALDLRAPDTALPAALDGADVVVHLAGPSEVLAAAHPERVLAETVAISSNLGRAAEEVGVGRTVYLSTIHVYGDRARPGVRLTEDLRPEPRHPYAIARLASEHVLASRDTELVVLRLTNSVGAPAAVDVDRWTLVVNDLCRTAVVDGVLRLHSDGTQWRDFVALTDAVRAIADVATGGGAAGTWNLGSGTARTVRDVAELVATSVERLSGRRPTLVAPDPRDDPPGPAEVAVDGLARSGIECSTPLGDAVGEIASFCWTHRDALAGAVAR